jgi:hypothetical protein
MVIMSRFRIATAIVIGLALTLCIATWWNASQELQAVTVANESLRKTLGELTVAITEKDMEIDRLAQANCGAATKLPAGSEPAQRKANRP